MSPPPLRYPLAVAQTCLLIVLMAVLRGPAYGPPAASATPPTRVATGAANGLDVEGLVPAVTQAALAERPVVSASSRLAVSPPTAPPLAGALGVTVLAVGASLWRRTRGMAAKR